MGPAQGHGEGVVLVIEVELSIFQRVLDEVTDLLNKTRAERDWCWAAERAHLNYICDRLEVIQSKLLEMRARR